MNCDLLCRQQGSCDASGYLSLLKAHDTNPQYHLGILPVSPLSSLSFDFGFFFIVPSDWIHFSDGFSGPIWFMYLVLISEMHKHTPQSLPPVLVQNKSPLSFPFRNHKSTTSPLSNPQSPTLLFNPSSWTILVWSTVGHHTRPVRSRHISVTVPTEPDTRHIEYQPVCLSCNPSAQIRSSPDIEHRKCVYAGVRYIPVLYVTSPTYGVTS
jgi:hypothetical protein